MAHRHVRIFTGEIEAFGGAERSILALCIFLQQHGIAHSVLTYRDSVGLGRYSTAPLQVEVLQPQGGVRAKVAALRSFIAQHDGMLLASGYQAALHATLAGQRGFDTLMHDTPALFNEASPSWKSSVRTWLSNLILRRGLNSGGKTIVTSEFLRADCWRDFHVHAEIARMGGLQTMPFRERRVIDSRLNLLSVSRLEGNKRIDWIVDALAELEARTPALSTTVDWNFQVAGKGSQLGALEQQVRRSNLQGRIRFLGFVPDAELTNLFAETHLFVMPAVQGYGIPAVEALQAGIPVLLHRESGVSDVLLDTPWATVAEGGSRQMVAALDTAIRKTIEGRHLGVPLPALDTEQSWAKRVAEICRWVPTGPTGPA